MKFRLKPPRKPSDEHPDVLRARAEAMTEAVGIAATYERKMADAGTVRMVLGHRALDAWRVYYERVEPGRTLEASAATRRKRSPSLAADASSEPDTEQGQAVPVNAAADTGSPDNVVQLVRAQDAGDICHRCGEVVTWVEHLPPVSLYSGVRCFVEIVAPRQRLGHSVKVPE